MDMDEKQNRRRAGASMLIVLDVLLLLLVLAIATHTIVVSRLRMLKPAVQHQLEFWQKRSDELCIDPSQRPATPRIREDADALEQLNSLAHLNDFSQKVWEEYESCKEPVSKQIPEALLHFKFNRYDEYEGNAETGFSLIRTYVDQFINSHNQIYVLGHTDDVAGDEYNYELSYRRALEVSGVIQSHLARLGKKRGRDYEIYAIGMGKAKLLPRKADDTLEQWRTNCRRLELEFRSLSRAQQTRK